MKTVVFYYSQTGQARRVAESVARPMAENGNRVFFKPIIPLENYPYPWSSNSFFGVFPECRLSEPPSGIRPIDLADVMDADVVLLVGQSWFLSPSLPLQSFFRDESIRSYLYGRKIIFINVCRNMWLMTLQSVKRLLREIGGTLVGHIVLQDRHSNLISAYTVVRWLMFGKKEASCCLPAAGVSEADILHASRFGKLICSAVERHDTDHLQNVLLSEGAIDYKPSILFLEKKGHRMFGFWARFIRKKGKFGCKQRLRRQNAFFAYLLLVLFIVSPFGQLLFYASLPFRDIARYRREDCSID